MGLYNFQPRFVPFILDGRKKHTIRAPRANPDKPGNTLHLYTGLRTKKAKLLMRAICVKIEFIEIGMSAEEVEDGFPVWVDGNLLSQDEKTLLAQRDGFDDFPHMRDFWRNRLPFRGHIIHWK